MTDAVLLAAHGSRVASSNAEVEDLAGRFAEALESARGAGWLVRCAFLELASPSIDETIDSLAGEGVERIIVIPYFLAAGRHVREDIPAIIHAARERHPGLMIEMTDHFGAQDHVLELLSALVAHRAES